jgi:hypothetical protein
MTCIGSPSCQSLCPQPFQIFAQRDLLLLVFYRGLRCPICKTQLRELESKLEEFDKRGVAVVAVSSDTKERAAQTREAWGLTRLRIRYYGLLASGKRAAGDCSFHQGAG